MMAISLAGSRQLIIARPFSLLTDLIKLCSSAAVESVVPSPYAPILPSQHKALYIVSGYCIGVGDGLLNHIIPNFFSPMI